MEGKARKLRPRDVVASPRKIQIRTEPGSPLAHSGVHGQIGLRPHPHSSNSGILPQDSKPPCFPSQQQQ
jgi:hypothetical protein